MSKKRKQLSQAEIWDDSALLQSWEDALNEYKLYHSIHVKGERVEDVITASLYEDETAHSVAENNENIAEDGQAVEGSGEDLEDGELEEEMTGSRIDAPTSGQRHVSQPTIHQG
ncbi:MAG: hypothetical protein Q9163_002275 [Psora crenata]